ncbi:IclR family transcriptional regulator [Halorientalis marina]|jgi:DNA-binding IclR family transcriptional regulator|uniref:IclR family transcriptional regulator n=1 Tax=Halorientalis marina TaxID=2931976 RepID=UPI001FF569BA|nr:IclR family transcriptional regulator [Halorientalis marina]
MIEDNTKTGVGSDRTLFSIIEYLQNEGEAGVTEIANGLELSKGAVHKHLSTMEDYGYVNNNSGKYRLDFGLLTHGGYVRDNCTLCRLAQPELGDLVEEVDELVSFAIKHRKDGIYTHIRNDNYEMRNFVPLGSRVPLHQTAAGKAILAMLPTGEVQTLFESELPTKTEKTIGSIDVLQEELEQVRNQGFAISNEESLRGVMSIASGVEGKSTLGAISVSVPAKGRKPEYLQKRFGEKIIDASTSIELNIKYRD